MSLTITARLDLFMPSVLYLIILFFLPLEIINERSRIIMVRTHFLLLMLKVGTSGKDNKDSSESRSIAGYNRILNYVEKGLI